MSIFMLTSDASAETEQLARALGADDYIVKPVPAPGSRGSCTGRHGSRRKEPPVGELDGIVKEFVIEARENLDQLERDLIELESHPSSRDTLASIFRTVHTIKGAAGFVGLSEVESLAHSGESVLSRLRDGSLVINPAIASALLALADCMRGMLAHVDETGTEGATDDGAVDRAAARRFSTAARSPSADAPATAPLDPGEIDRPAQSSSTVRVSVDQLDTLDEPGRRAGAGAQRDRAVQRRSAEHRPAQLVAAAQRDHDAAAGRDHEDPHAADRQRLEDVAARGPRCGAILRQAGSSRDGGQGYRAGPDPDRGDQGPADPRGSQLHRPRRGNSRKAAGGRKAARKAVCSCARSTKAAR